MRQYAPPRDLRNDQHRRNLDCLYFLTNHNLPGARARASPSAKAVFGTAVAGDAICTRLSVVALLTVTLGGGPVMIVAFEPPGLNRVGSLHPLTLTREDARNVDVGTFQAARGNSICAIS